MIIAVDVANVLIIFVCTANYGADKSDKDTFFAVDGVAYLFFFPLSFSPLSGKKQIQKDERHFKANEVADPSGTAA